MTDAELIISSEQKNELELHGISTQGANDIDIAEFEKKIDSKADKEDVYTKEETNTALDKKLDAGTEKGYVSKVEVFDDKYHTEYRFFDKDGNEIESIGVENYITQGSTNPVSSGAVYNAIGDIDTALKNIIDKYGLGGDSV